MSAIPSSAQYSLKPSAVKAKRYQRVVPSLGNNPNSGYTTGTSPDTIIFYLPSMANQVMDGQSAVLKFTTSTVFTGSAGGTGGYTVELDGTASCFINRVDIYGSGGALIESISNYGVLSSIYHDIFYSQSEQKGLSAQIGSAEGDTTNVLNRHGLNIGTSTVTTATTETFTRTFSIPILSSLFQFSENFFPVFALNSDVRIEVVLNNLVSSVIGTASAGTTLTSISIVNPEIIVDYIELESNVIDQMRSVYAGRDLVVHSTSVHNYQTTVSVNTGSNYNTILPSKVMSAKYGLFSFRPTGLTNAQTYATLSTRMNPFRTANSQFNLNIGGMRVPQRPLLTAVTDDISNYFASTQNAFHAQGALLANGCLPYTTYLSVESSNPAVLAPGTANTYGFVIGINLDTFVRQSDTMLSGTDLSKVTTYIEANFARSAGTYLLYTLDSFICHDILLIIDGNGTLTSKF